MCVLVDHQIEQLILEGYIQDYDLDKIEAASYDLRTAGFIRRQHPVWSELRTILEANLYYDKPDKMKALLEKYPLWGPVEEADEFFLRPGELVLCRSIEYIIMPRHLCGILVLKSSGGRNGLNHSHSGYVDPGFRGTLTFEFTNETKRPYHLIAGKAHAQLVYHQLGDKPQRSYDEKAENYNDQIEPTPAREETA